MKRSTLSKAYFWEETPFFRMLIPLIAAIVCYDFHWIYNIATIKILFFSIILLCAFTTAHFLRSISLLIVLLRFISFSLLMFFIGLLACSTQDIKQSQTWFGKRIDTNVAYIATIMESPAEKAKTIKLKVKITGYVQQDKFVNEKGKAFLYLYKDSTARSLKEADILLLPGTWQPIKNTGNPFEFDYVHYCARNNIYHQQFLSSANILVLKNNKQRQSFIRHSHNWCMSQLEKYVKDPDTRGLLQAMLLGEEVNMDTELRQAYAETGIIHIVAISGSHVASFFLIISSLLFWIKNKKYSWVKYLAGVVFVWFYVLMAGAPPSAVRAAIMFSLLAIGFIFQKNRHPLNQLLATAFVLLIAKPTWLFAVGFQLSFLAVLSLIIFHQRVYKIIQLENKIVRKCWGALAASISAEILVAPLVAYYFHMFPAMFLVANLAAVFLMSFVLLTGAFIIIFSWCAPIASSLSIVVIFIVSCFNKLVYFLQQFNPASFRYLQVSFPELFILYSFILFAAVAIIRKNTQAVYGAFCFACLLFGLYCVDEYRALKQNRLVIYQADNKNVIEKITGKKIVQYSFSKENHIMKTAHTGWHVWKTEIKSNPNCWLINGKKILQIDTTKGLAGSSDFPADILLLNNRLKYFSFSEIKNTFHPQMIVACGYQTKWYINKWKDSCAKNAIKLSIPTTDGIVVIE